MIDVVIDIMPRRILGLVAVTTLAVGGLTACSGTSDETTEGTVDLVPDSLTIVAYESFIPPDDAFDQFTADTGIGVRIRTAGDAGEMVSKAILTAGNPEGDVLWGVDNTLLQRALDADVFDPYASPEPALLDELASTTSVVTPVDYGDVCVNYDIDYLDVLGLEPPTSFDDLTKPEYTDLLVTADPTTSSTGLAFMLGTRVAFGDAWTDYWRELVDNGLLVVNGWEDAYYTSFTLHGGDRPLVVSYASSPPAEIVFADPPLPAGVPPISGVAAGTCFRQIEYVGVLKGTKHVEAARRLVDYLVGAGFQSILPESLFVYPANDSVDLPESFTTYAPRIESPYSLTPDEIATNRDGWLEQWSQIVG